MKRRILSAVIALTMAFALTACSNGTTGTTGTTPATEAATEKKDEKPAQGVTDTKIVVGNSATTSGAYAPVGTPFLTGIRAYFKMVNEKEGGVSGRTIEFKNIDDEFDPVKGKTALQKLVEDEQVFALVGHFGTPVVAATLEDVKEYGIPAVYFATGIGQLYNDKATGRDRNIFPVQPLYKTEGKIMVARAVGDFEAKKVGIIYTNDDAGKDILWGAQQQCKELGVELVEQQVAVGATDVSAAVTAIKGAGVDVVIAGEIQATFPTVVKELAAQTVNKPVITTYVNVSSAMSDAVKAEIDGKFDVYGNGWVATDGDKAEAYELYKEWIAKEAGSDEFAANTYAMTGWIAGHYFVQGLKQTEGTLTWDNFMSGLEAKPIENPFGGIIDYSNGKRLGTNEMNLSKVDATNATGWSLVKPLQNIDSILGK